MTKTTKNKNTFLTLRIDPEVKKRLEHEARSENRTTSHLAQNAIDHFLEQRELETQLVEILTERAENAQEPDWISEKPVLDWINSWWTENTLPMPTK
jgi:predicted transcriptional regulator